MNNSILKQADSYCKMIKRDKPCSCQAIQDRYVEELTLRIHEVYGLKTYIEDLAPMWKTLWTYKDDYMLSIIKSLPNEPKTPYDHWVLGKAFGYSNEAIRIFLEEVQY